MSEKDVLKYHPIALRLRDVKSVVIGGGRIAERKVSQLLEAESKIQVVSPQATSGLRRLARERTIKWVKKRVTRADLKNADIVIAATNDAITNEKISKWASANRVWVNVVDNSRLSSFISPAVVRLKECVLAVYTDGKDPELSRDLKNFIKESWNDFLSYRNRSQKDPA